MGSETRDRRAAWSLACAALVVLASPAASATNYLVIIGDDIGVDKVRAYAGDYTGYAAGAAYLPRTDTIDSLATAGLRFTRGWANPVCSPTRASFQSGVHAFRTGVGTALKGTDPGLDTTAFTMFAESFQSAGYATGLFGKWHVGTEDAAGNKGAPTTSPFYDAPHPSLAGWQRFFGKLEGDIDDYFDWPRVGWRDSGIGYTGTETTHATDRTAAVASNWINSRSSDWFAVVSFHAPHAKTAVNDWTYADVDPTRYRSPGLSCLATSSCVDEDRAVYQGLVEHMDLEIEGLLNSIDPEELDDTIIIFFGDNGTPSVVQEDVFDVSPPRGKGTTYENGVRVPFVVADGGTWRTGAAGDIVSPNRTVGVGAHVMDIYQTLHNHALMLSVAFVDSRQFVDCFTDTRSYCGLSRRFGYAETYRFDEDEDEEKDEDDLLSAKVALRYGHDKMVAVYDAVAGCMEETFYYTLSDPLETSPASWATWREDRLRDEFIAMHAADPAYWGNGLAFCP